MPSALHLPNPQGATSPTWMLPDLSGASTPGEIFEQHAKNSPSHVWATWENHRTGTREQITYAEWWTGLHRAVAFLLRHLDLPPDPSGPEDRCVVALFANTDQLTYALLLHALIYLGHTAFPISPRNSVAALAHLLGETRCERLIVAGGEPIRRLTQEAGVELRRQFGDGSALKVVDAPTFSTLFPKYGPGHEEVDEPIVRRRVRKPSMDEIVVITHSSGSTSFPKPIPMSQAVCIQWMRIPWYGEGDLCGRVLGSLTVPPFHAMGMACLIWQCFGSGAVAGVFDPTGPLVVLSPDAVLRGLKSVGADWCMAVPSFFETWAQDPQAMQFLASMSFVMFGGGPLTPAAGETLVSHGVKLVCMYGATEIGCPHVFGLPRDYAGEFTWLRFSRQMTYRLDPQEQERVYELICVASEHYTPCVLNVPGKEEYATSDLIELHPDDENLFRVVGRVDDQLMLSTGEKTNAGPIEQIISSSPFVQHAVMFGRGRAQNGILIQPSGGHDIDPHDERQLSKFRSDIWDKVEEANAFAPQHSHIFKEMILVTSPDKPMPLTSKRTVMRKTTLALYDPEIEACYAALEKSAEVAHDIPAPTDWNESSSLAFVRRLVTRVVERQDAVPDDADLFQNGLDSLRATYLRNSIGSGLRTSMGEKSTRLPSDFVFAHPTIRSLSSAISALASSSGNESSNAADSEASHVKAMEDAVRKYTSQLPVHTPDERHPVTKSGEEVVVLTGSTGGLGSHLLAQLVETKTVVKIYALNRKSESSLIDRQTAVLAERLGSAERADQVARSPKVCLVEAELDREDLGISEKLFEEIRTTTKLIIHNAWRLDFNLFLASFAPQLDSVRTLVHLALRSPHTIPPRILFTSSVGTLSNWSSDEAVPEEPLQDLRIAVGNGYGESKAVAERILEVVAAQTPVKTTNFRIGQLAGSSGSGAWATSDWVPLIARGGQEVGALPDGRGVVTWIPVDVAASAILDMRQSTSQTLHIVHPHPVPWSFVMGALARMLGQSMVPFSAWVERLEKSAEDPAATRTNPALALVDFFKTLGRSFATEGVSEDREAGGMAKLSLSKSTSQSSNLMGAASLTEGDVGRWVEYWKMKRFLHQ